MTIKPGLVIFGTSNILSDLVDCAHANGQFVTRIVTHLPERTGERDLSLADRLPGWAALGHKPAIEPLETFKPHPGEVYLLGPTTPARAALADLVTERFGLSFTTLVHPSACVSPLASLGRGCFVGAASAIGPGAALAEQVFVNRGVTIGHDTAIGAYSRVQPGANIGGLCRIGRSVTVGIGATVIERLQIGDHSFVGAGSVVTKDVEADIMVFGVPAKFLKSLPRED